MLNAAEKSKIFATCFSKQAFCSFSKDSIKAQHMVRCIYEETGLFEEKPNMNKRDNKEMIESNYIGNYSNHKALDVCYSLKIESIKGQSKYLLL